ncbi:uncharacterized protein CBL_12007 [Carabus blaptoides fortunei]
MEGKKKQKLTAEEKKILKEQKKIEKKLQAEETKRQIKRAELQRELEYGAKSRKKLEETWKQTLTDMKVPELREYFELAVFNAEYKLDMKDFTISLLLDQLDEAEEQYRMTMNSHSEDTRRIIAQFKDKMEEMSNGFNMTVHDMLKDGRNEQTELREQSKSECNEQDMALDKLTKEGSKMLKKEFKSRMDTLQKKNSTELETKRGTYENRFENLWNEYLTTLQTYLDNTAETRREYEEHVKKEQYHVNECKVLKKKLCWLREFIRLAKEQLVAEKEEYEERIKCMREARRRLYGYIRRGNELITEGMKIEHKQLSAIVQESNAVIKEMEDFVGKGEKILRWVSLCKKHETSSEKVFPFPQFNKDNTTSEIKLEIDNDLRNMCENVDKLKGFWVKYGEVELSLIQMKHERTYLQHENQKLRNQILNHCCKTSAKCAKHVALPKCSKF